MCCLFAGLRLYFYFQSKIGYIVYPTKFIPQKSKQTTLLVQIFNGMERARIHLIQKISIYYIFYCA